MVIAKFGLLYGEAPQQFFLETHYEVIYHAEEALTHVRNAYEAWYRIAENGVKDFEAGNVDGCLANYLDAHRRAIEMWWDDMNSPIPFAKGCAVVFVNAGIDREKLPCYLNYVQDEREVDCINRLGVPLFDHLKDIVKMENEFMEAEYLN